MGKCGNLNPHARSSIGAAPVLTQDAASCQIPFFRVLPLTSAAQSCIIGMSSLRTVVLYAKPLIRKGKKIKKSVDICSGVCNNIPILRD